MGQKILVFTGAGISVPLGLPATDGFDPTIKKIHSNLRAQINSYYPNKDGQDIEKILFLLEDFVRQNDFTHHIVKQGIGSDTFRDVYNNLESYKAMAEAGIETIKADIYDVLESYDQKKSSLLYSSMVKELKEEYGDDSAISIFTTNYDLTFENGFADTAEELQNVGINDVFYGFGGARNGKAVYNPREDFDWNPKVIEYKKLHGSLDWNLDRNNTCVKTGSAISPKSPSRMPMLYPGFKGIPSSQPFIDLHEKLDKRLAEADMVYVLGFAFRDDFINNIFDYGLKRNSNLKVLCYNPCDLKNLPSDSKLANFCSKYKGRFIHIPLYIEAKENPLTLPENLTKNVLGPLMRQ